MTSFAAPPRTPAEYIASYGPYEPGCRCYRCSFVDAARDWASSYTGHTSPAILAAILADAGQVIGDAGPVDIPPHRTPVPAFARCMTCRDPAHVPGDFGELIHGHPFAEEES